MLLSHLYSGGAEARAREFIQVMSELGCNKATRHRRNVKEKYFAVCARTTSRRGGLCFETPSASFMQPVRNVRLIRAAGLKAGVWLSGGGQAEANDLIQFIDWGNVRIKIK